MANKNLSSLAALASLKDRVKRHQEDLERERLRQEEVRRQQQADSRDFLAEMQRLGVARSTVSSGRADTPQPRKRPPAPVAEPEPEPEPSAAAEWSPQDDAPAWRSYAHGIGEDVVKKLRRGFWTVQDEIDLHGLTADGALEELERFVAASERNGFRCVRVIHGKGWNSHRREPILKPVVRHWLRRHPGTLAYAEPGEPDGGSGAVVVLLAPAARR